MNRNRPYLNKFIKQKQLEITDTYHNLNMKDMKPITSRLMEHTDTVIINNSKREKIKQVRGLEIDRENKLLLDKIQSVMSKKGAYSASKSKNIRTKVNKSLNQIFRKKQDEQITEENKRFLARLQSKKPTLNLQKLNRDWKDNKSVIKRMAHYQFYLTTFKSKETHNKSGFSSEKSIKGKIQTTRITKIKVIDGHKMMIKIQFLHGFLKITGDTLNSKNLKVIEIPKEEALIFVEQECDSSIEKIIEKLRYDESNDTLYIVSSSLEDQQQFKEFNPEVAKSSIENKKSLKESAHKPNKSSISHHSIEVKEEINKKSIEVVPSANSALAASNNKSTIKSDKSDVLVIHKPEQHNEEEKVLVKEQKIEPHEEQFEDEPFEQQQKKQAEAKQIIEVNLVDSKQPVLVEQKQQPLQSHNEQTIHNEIQIEPESNEIYKEFVEEIKQPTIAQAVQEVKP